MARKIRQKYGVRSLALARFLTARHQASKHLLSTSSRRRASLQEFFFK